MNIYLTLPQEKLTPFYLVQVSRESRGSGMHFRCHWLHLSLLLMKLFKHNLNSGITKTGKKTSKEDLQLQRTGLLWTELEMLLFSFVRSLRLRQYDFSLFTASFEAMLPWLASLDQSDYLRLGCIFLCHMLLVSACVSDEFT